MNDDTKVDWLIRIAIGIGLALIIVLGFLAAGMSAARSNLQAELAKSLERERACTLQLWNDHIAPEQTP